MPNTVSGNSFNPLIVDSLTSDGTTWSSEKIAEYVAQLGAGIGTDGSVVSISRTDTWNANVEYDFGGGLYGQRFTGAISGDKDAVIDTTLIPNISISYFGDFGGIVWDSAGRRFPLPYYHSAIGYTAIANDGSGGLRLSSKIDYANRTNAPYDVWVTYKK
jgi:hypothetical protein